MAEPGTYVLVMERSQAAVIEIGALGTIEFPAGGYGYVGSAFGPGGLARVDRHRSIASGEKSTRHWHIDYFLGHPGTQLVDVVLFPGRDLECALATGIDADSIDRFGASDCDCQSHLLYAAEPSAIVSAVEPYR